MVRAYDREMLRYTLYRYYSLSDILISFVVRYMQAGFSAVLVLLVLLFSFSISAAYPPRSIIQMALGTCNIPSLPEKMESHLNRSLLKSLKHWSGTDKEKEAKTWKMIVDMKELASEQIRGKEDSASLNTYRKNVNAMCDSVIKHLSKSAGGSKMDEENLKIHSIIEEHALQIQHNKELFANIVDHHHKLIEKVSTGGQSWENAISSDSASLSRYADAAKEMGEKAWVQQGKFSLEEGVIVRGYYSILMTSCVMWSNVLDLYNIISISYNHHTDIYPLLNT